MFTTEELSKAILDKKQEIIDEIVRGLKDDCKQNLGWEIKDQMQSAARAAFEEHLREEVKSLVVNNKEALLAELHKAMLGILANIGSALEVAAAEKLKNSWERNKILKAIFE